MGIHIQSVANTMSFEPGTSLGTTFFHPSALKAEEWKL
jgi:hypothetical protein